MLRHRHQDADLNQGNVNRIDLDVEATALLKTIHIVDSASGVWSWNS